MRKQKSILDTVMELEAEDNLINNLDNTIHPIETQFPACRNGCKEFAQFKQDKDACMELCPEKFLIHE